MSIRFSLVVPTLNRQKEVEDFMKGLEQQTFTDFEVILVDQSGTDLYEDIVARYSQKWPLQHIRCDVRKPRYACNLGARYASGEIISFPDDDCIYQPDTLARVDEHFRQNPSLGFVTGAVLNLDGKPTEMGRWLTSSQPLTRDTVWTGLIEFNFFMQKKFFDQVDGFDANLGPGCPYGSCEGPDLALRLMSKGARGWHDRSLLVRHMDKSVTINGERAFAYGMGMGYVMRKNHASVKMTAKVLIRSFGGMIISLLRRRSDLTTYYWNTLKGRFSGYFCLAASKAARRTA